MRSDQGYGERGEFVRVNKVAKVLNAKGEERDGIRSGIEKCGTGSACPVERKVKDV